MSYYIYAKSETFQATYKDKRKDGFTITFRITTSEFTIMRTTSENVKR